MKDRTKLRYNEFLTRVTDEEAILIRCFCSRKGLRFSGFIRQCILFCIRYTYSYDRLPWD